MTKENYWTDLAGRIKELQDYFNKDSAFFVGYITLLTIPNFILAYLLFLFLPFYAMYLWTFCVAVQFFFAYDYSRFKEKRKRRKTE